MTAKEVVNNALTNAMKYGHASFIVDNESRTIAYDMVECHRQAEKFDPKDLVEHILNWKVANKTELCKYYESQKEGRL